MRGVTMEGMRSLVFYFYFIFVLDLDWDWCVTGIETADSDVGPGGVCLVEGRRDDW